jgi:phage gpG-like protein
MAKKDGITINEGDLNSLKKKIQQLGQLAAQELSNELAYTAAFAVQGMKVDVKKDTGNLMQSIFFERVGKNRVSIFAKAPYAPYVEFGTGRKVDLSHLKALGFNDSYAAQFKGKGIKEVVLPARPFFFTNIKKELNKLEVRLDNKIKQLTK